MQLDKLLGFFFSFIFSFYILLSWISRLGLVVYVATFALAVLLYTRKRPSTILKYSLIILCLILIFAYWVSLWLNLKTSGSLFGFLAKEFSFPFASFFGQMDSGENLFRGFKDFIFSPLYFLPSSLWATWVEDIAQVNTELIIGAPKGEQGVTGTVPVDLLTLGLMQAHVFGVIVVGMLFGFMLRMIQVFLDSINHKGVRVTLEAYIAIKIAIQAIYYSSPAQIIYANYALIISVLILAFCRTTFFLLVLNGFMLLSGKASRVRW